MFLIKLYFLPFNKNVLIEFKWALKAPYTWSLSDEFEFKKYIELSVRISVCIVFFHGLIHDIDLSLATSTNIILLVEARGQEGSGPAQTQADSSLQAGLGPIFINEIRGWPRRTWSKYLQGSRNRTLLFSVETGRVGSDFFFSGWTGPGFHCNIDNIL